MNDYVEVKLTFEPCNETMTDVMAAMLADAGYESFVADENSLTAYVKAETFDNAALDDVITNFPLDTDINSSHITIEGRDWNAEWERNYFQPIVAGGGRCVIHSSFHTNIPQADYDITIDPKMAFGTGHHATTSLIIDRLMEMNLQGVKMVDMGTGTAILAILATMRGAIVTGIEIDPFAYANALDNIVVNGHPEIKLIEGDASTLAGITGIELFVANINRNVIVGDMEHYVATLVPGAKVIFSGFYVDDIPIVSAAAEAAGLTAVNHTERDRWASLLLTLPER